MTATLIAIVAALALFVGLSYFRSNGWAWVTAIALFLIATMIFLPGERSIVLWVITWLLFSAVAAVLNYAPVRRNLLSDPIFAWYKNSSPLFRKRNKKPSKRTPFGGTANSSAANPIGKNYSPILNRC